MKRFQFLFFAFLAACAPPELNEVATRGVIADTTLPPMKVFASPRPAAPQRSNQDIARDFLDLSFRLESGRELPILTRFETAITVRVTGKPPANLQPDLSRLLYRLRSEARIDISQTSDANANITIEVVDRATIRRHLPQAACFVVPNITSIKQYRAARRSSRSNWSMMRNREHLAIFLPGDASPQEVRDCLHEELAQALGPLNDLYRLSDSVFNDDNMHAVLTGFDMLVLRAYYDRSLHSGMTRAQVGARLPAILARINPQPIPLAARNADTTPLAWINSVQTALGPGAGSSARIIAATKALQIAKDRGWQDHRRGFSHFTLGRLIQSRDADIARTHFINAAHFFRLNNANDPHLAFATAQLAAYAIAAGDGTRALELIQPHLAQAAQYENASLLATLLLLKAEALDLSDRGEEARRVRLDSLGWARYGFGADWAVRAKLREIAALSPIKRRN
jgi:hypothetical protein